MKKKSFLLVLSLGLCFSLLGIINVNATEELTLDSEEIGSIEDNHFADGHDHGNGFEDWYVGNPLLREFYGGYQRNGSFYIVRASDKKVFFASQLKVTWKTGGGVNKSYYVPELNADILESNAYYVKEYIDVSETFTLTRTAETYSHPFVTSVFQRGETLAPGTYSVSRVALELIEIVKADGTKVWISPQYKPNDTFLSTNYGRFVDSKQTLSIGNIRGVPIHQKMMPIREDKRTGIAMKPQYVTIHNTGNSGHGANAAAHANGQINDSRTWVSWHYTVDNKEIYQSIPMNEVAYHAGDGTNIGNGATIAIEICENADGNYAIAEKNAAYLTARLLYENNLPATAVRQHKDWSGKNCPRNILEGTKGTMGWTAFMALVKTEYDKIVSENQAANEEKGDTEIPLEFQEILKANGHTFENGHVYGFKEGTTLQSILNQWKTTDPNLSMEVTKDAKVVSLTNSVASGQVAKITMDGKTIKVVLIVKGDVSGDGKISAMDYVFVKNHILKIQTLNNNQSMSADVNKDGKISALDYVAIKNHILNISKIGD